MSVTVLGPAAAMVSWHEPPKQFFILQEGSESQEPLGEYSVVRISVAPTKNTLFIWTGRWS